jgi:hypothetical protein
MPEPAEQFDLSIFAGPRIRKPAPGSIFHAAFTLVRTLRSRRYSIETSTAVHRHGAATVNAPQAVCVFTQVRRETGKE